MRRVEREPREARLAWAPEVGMDTRRRSLVLCVKFEIVCLGSDGTPGGEGDAADIVLD